MSILRRRLMMRGGRQVTFYVFHSSNKQIEKVISNPNEAFPMQTLVAANHFYGGTYSAYGFEGDICAKIREGNYEDFQNINVVIDSTAEIYDGTATFQKVDGKAVMYWTKADGYTSSIIPEQGALYILKEVPSDYYLQTKGIVTRDSSTNEINSVYVVINFDDPFYDSISKTITISGGEPTTERITIHSSITIDGIKKTSETEFGRRGYIGPIIIWTSSFAGVEAHLQATVVTLDGVEHNRFIDVHVPQDLTEDADFAYYESIDTGTIDNPIPYSVNMELIEGKYYLDQNRETECDDHGNVIN